MQRVIIVEDNGELRNTLQFFINQSQEFICENVFGDAESLLFDSASYEFDLGLIDIHLPGITGIELIQKLKVLYPKKQFIILTVFEDVDSIFQALKAGATGYLLKSTTPAKILEALHEVSQGGSPMSGPIARKVIQEFVLPEIQNPTCPPELTEREFEILQLLSKGFRYKEIAGHLYISIETVRTHIRNVYQKLQVQSGIEAINKVFGTKN